MLQKLDDLILTMHEKVVDLAIKTVGADKYSCATQANIAGTLGLLSFGGTLLESGIRNSSPFLISMACVIGPISIISYKKGLRDIKPQKKIDENNALKGTRQIPQYNTTRPFFWSLGTYAILSSPFSETIPTLLIAGSLGLYLSGNESRKYFLNVETPSGTTDSLLDKLKAGISNIGSEPVRVSALKYETKE
ncbi:hypothetical protein HQ489_00840 [Candidatus Woesearchaeota archaeon]|nr:hypothetical protein [Candidatus Woesearchaeota archaeon]